MSEQNKDTIMISLDTSSKRTGWAMYINGEYYSSGIYDFSSYTGTTEQRIKIMVQYIIRDFEVKHPDIVVIEKDIVMNNMVTINSLTKIIGSVYGYCIMHDVFYFEFQPSEWRKLVGIKEKKREQCKKVSIQLIKDKMNKEVSDDEADAINIGQAYINLWTKE